MIDQQRNRLAMPRCGHLFVPIREFRCDSLAVYRPVLLLVKVDEQEHLILYRRKQVVLFDEIEYLWPAQAEEVGQGFARLMLDYVSAQCQLGIGCGQKTHNSAKHSISVGDDLTASSSPWTATMTA
jgi:hypothetical protein